MTGDGMLADGGQLIGVLLIMAAAVGYLTIYYRRVIKGDKSGGCGCGIPFKGTCGDRETSSSDDRSPGAGRRQFVPVENLADLAARRRQEHEGADASDDPEATDPDTADADRADPDRADPDSAEPDRAEPGTTEPGTTEPPSRREH